MLNNQNINGSFQGGYADDQGAFPPVNDESQNNIAEQNNLQQQLSAKLYELFDVVMKGRKEFYASNPDKVPTKESVPYIIESYANKNFKISGSISLIPGPWGMAAAIPEIALVIRNQLCMIYDIGVAYGNNGKITRELLAGILMYSMGGAGGGTLLLMRGGQVFVRRASLRVFQKVVAMLGGKVTQRLLKSMISKWLPVVGAAAMAAWSKYSTSHIGKKAVEIFEQDIQFIDAEVDANALPDVQLPAVPEELQSNDVDIELIT